MALCHCIRAAAVTNRATENENISPICIGEGGRREGGGDHIPACLLGILASALCGGKAGHRRRRRSGDWPPLNRISGFRCNI